MPDGILPKQGFFPIIVLSSFFIISNLQYIFLPSGSTAPGQIIICISLYISHFPCPTSEVATLRTKYQSRSHQFLQCSCICTRLECFGPKAHQARKIKVQIQKTGDLRASYLIYKECIKCMKEGTRLQLNCESHEMSGKVGSTAPAPYKEQW